MPLLKKNRGDAKMQKETMRVPEAAQLLGCSQQAVRERIRRGIWKFGEVIPKEKTGNEIDSFIIYKRKLYKHLGIEEVQNDETQTA